jgi:hypothetical protein
MGEEDSAHRIAAMSHNRWQVVKLTRQVRTSIEQECLVGRVVEHGQAWAPASQPGISPGSFTVGLAAAGMGYATVLGAAEKHCFDTCRCSSGSVVTGKGVKGAEGQGAGRAGHAENK